jgi:S1-C subfamily serine protease
MNRPVQIVGATKAFLFFVLGLLIGACMGPTQVVAAGPSTSSHVDAAADLESKTVALVGRTRDGELRAYCSGVWVSRTSILTAQHCVEDMSASDRIEYAVRSDIYAPGEVRVREHVATRAAHVYATDVGHDLALLSAIDAPAHAVATTTFGPVRQGAFAQTMGHSLSLWWSYSTGDVAAVRQMDLDLDIVWIQATTPISRGNSGCGLFDEDGRLMGIAHGSLPFGEMINVFVHSQYIDAFLRGQVTL